MFGLTAKLLGLIGTVLTLIPAVYLGFHAYRAKPWEPGAVGEDGVEELRRMVFDSYKRVVQELRRWHFISAAIGLALIVIGSVIDLAVSWRALS